MVKLKSYEKMVEGEILSFAFMSKWSLDVFDSAVIPSRDRQKTKLPNGTPDLVGNDNNGLALFIELKKKGEEDTCRLSQYQFLTRKIESNAFGCVISSQEQLQELYSEWLKLREESFDKARKYLLEQLPKKVLVNGKIQKLSVL